MNLEKFIKMKMIMLSEKYDMSLIEISKIKENKMKKVINFNYKPINSNITDNICKTFYNRRDLVSWLSCLE